MKLLKLIVGLMLLAACGSSGDSGAGSVVDQPAATTTSELAAPEASTSTTVEADAADSETDEPKELVVCDAAEIGEEDGEIVAIYRVVGGVLGKLCLGDPNNTVELAWGYLSDVAPPESLANLGLFAGFDGGVDAETLAFAINLDEEIDAGFAVAVEIRSTEDDPTEARLTMMHEFAHVFTQTSDQIDASDEYCEDRYWNGSGCALDSSYLAQWVEDFWTVDSANEAVEAEDPDSAGARLCSLDSTFLGSYSATSADEDFAEAFSAYVYGVNLPSDNQERVLWFEQFPELREFRANAVATGQFDLPNNFDGCG